MSSSANTAAADVVTHGVVLPEWAPHTGGAVVTSLQVERVFAAWLIVNASLALQSVTAVSQNSSVCTASVSSSQGGTMSPQPALLTVSFVCLSEGNVEVIVALELLGFDPVTFGFTKRCGGTEHLLSTRLMLTVFCRSVLDTGSQHPCVSV